MSWHLIAKGLFNWQVWLSVLYVSRSRAAYRQELAHHTFIQYISIVTPLYSIVSPFPRFPVQLTERHSVPLPAH